MRVAAPWQPSSIFAQLKKICAWWPSCPTCRRNSRRWPGPLAVRTFCRVPCSPGILLRSWKLPRIERNVLRDRKARRCCVYFSLIVFFHCAASLQGLAQSPSPVDPVSTLRDILFAACSQNSTEFARSLTFRNAEAFSRMTPATRTTLLKRFVLLDKPGQPRAEIDAGGNLNVYCTTSDVTTQLQIGKPELRDNLAYISLTVKNAAASDEDNSHRVLMGFVREAGQWKLLSLGLLLLDLPSLAEEWDRAEIKNNEQSAIDSMKNLAEAIETY